MKDYIYMYGQVMATYSFILENDFPQPDGIGLIGESNFNLGGETGTASVVLASLGSNVKIAGSHLGTKNAEKISTLLKKWKVDISELKYDKQFDGVLDYVFISGNTRTCFGEWNKLYNRKEPWFEAIEEDSIKNCNCVGFDPLLDGNDISVTELCKKYDKKFATIDCTYDSEFNRCCEINAVSHQYLKSVYGENVDFYDLHRKYTEQSNGLIIFTCGENELLYGRKNQEIKRFRPFSVDVKSTLGAGDSFKAGTIYALSKKMSDDDIVRYASAIAGVAISKYPISENPPTIEEVEALLSSR